MRVTALTEWDSTAESELVVRWARRNQDALLVPAGDPRVHDHFMSLRSRRLNAWFSGLLLVLFTGVSGCSGDGQPRAGPTTTASASGAASGGTSLAGDGRVADTAAEAVRERMALYDGVVPGALALVRAGKETRFVTRGYGDLDARAAMTPVGRFQVASVTKPMVATLVLQLAEASQLRLSDPVDRWLPGLVPGGGRITIEHLLSHRSGLPDYFTHTNSLEHYEPAQLVRIALANGPQTPVGTGMYANTNYIVLGLLIEAVTGQPLGEALQRGVFDPAGMRHTSFTPRHGGQPQIRGYTHTTDVTNTDLSVAWAAGGVVSTARDLDAFLTALRQGELVAPHTLTDMATSRGPLPNMGDVEYGLGLATPDAVCGAALGHPGNLRGYATGVWALQRKDRSVVVMINNAASGDVADEIAEAALCQ